MGKAYVGVMTCIGQAEDVCPDKNGSTNLRRNAQLAGYLQESRYPSRHAMLRYASIQTGVREVMRR
jgi:hypothetical protein